LPRFSTVPTYALRLLPKHQKQKQEDKWQRETVPDLKSTQQSQQVFLLRWPLQKTCKDHFFGYCMCKQWTYGRQKRRCDSQVDRRSSRVDILNVAALHSSHLYDMHHTVTTALFITSYSSPILLTAI